ncbi:hypothetical protein JZ751_026641 [Albula glossodonta]|uniref:Shisa N-terminal domain-containing protein n=1 Tax=Albula glossodonta TaxID=121402 RepID=A0A8T2PLV3_9TELE|nr:hypothetical protein JZ751_026641 [Albula glossodonta]
MGADPFRCQSRAAQQLESETQGKKGKTVPKRPPKAKEVNSTAVPTAAPRQITQVPPPETGGHETCLGYYDVSGQFDKEFKCNNTDHRYCCGSCFLRFCCQFKGHRLDQRTCTNYNTPDWVKTQPPSPVPTGDTYDPNLDQTNTTVYITCGEVIIQKRMSAVEVTIFTISSLLDL